MRVVWNSGSVRGLCFMLSHCRLTRYMHIFFFFLGSFFLACFVSFFLCFSLFPFCSTLSRTLSYYFVLAYSILFRYYFLFDLI